MIETWKITLTAPTNIYQFCSWRWQLCPLQYHSCFDFHFFNNWVFNLGVNVKAGFDIILQLISLLLNLYNLLLFLFSFLMNLWRFFSFSFFFIHNKFHTKIKMGMTSRCNNKKKETALNITIMKSHFLLFHFFLSLINNWFGCQGWLISL